MFGYVRAYKPELKFKEYDVYKGVYCSLCKTLLRRYGPLGQAFLTYDATFMALGFMAVSDACVPMRPSRCCYNPAKKCYSCGQNEILDYCADLSVLMVYYKVRDNLKDAGFWKKLLSALLYPILWLIHRKASKREPQAEKIVAQMMEQQELCERNADCLTDVAAEPTASALSRIAALRNSDEQFCRMFYLLGRFVYIIDAVDDVKRDIKSGDFNPLKKKYLEDPDHFADYALFLMNLNIGEMLRCFDLIPQKRYGSIIENILMDGLYNSALYVLKSFGDHREVEK